METQVQYLSKCASLLFFTACMLEHQAVIWHFASNSITHKQIKLFYQARWLHPYLSFCPPVAEMEGRADSGVTGRVGQSGKRLSSGQSVAEWAQQWPCRGSLRRRLSVEAVAAEAEVWL